MGKRFAQEVQMPQSPRQSGDDERIDRYVCGRLSPQDELEFEAEFIGNPSLVKKIEEAYALKQCLAEAKTQGGFNKPCASLWLRWCRYLAVPQTAWGAIAASLLLVPVFLDGNKQSSSLNVATVPVYMLEEEELRGASGSQRSLCEIKVASGQTQLFLGFVVPSAAGEYMYWNIEILDKADNRIWYGEKLSPDVRSVIYLRVDLNKDKYDSLKCVVKRSTDEVVN
jgi:hypothetical protein